MRSSTCEFPLDLLPEVPDLERLGRLFELKTALEVRLRRAIVLYLGMKHAWLPANMSKAILKGLEPTPDGKARDQLFIGTRPQDAVQELFTLDLKGVVVANWPVFQGLFENESKFSRAMDEVNVARRLDSHTKPVTAEEADAFERSYAWLLKRLDKLPDL